MIALEQVLPAITGLVLRLVTVYNGCLRAKACVASACSKQLGWTSGLTTYPRRHREKQTQESKREHRKASTKNASTSANAQTLHMHARLGTISSREPLLTRTGTWTCRLDKKKNKVQGPGSQLSSPNPKCWFKPQSPGSSLQSPVSNLFVGSILQS